MSFDPIAPAAGRYDLQTPDGAITGVIEFTARGPYFAHSIATFHRLDTVLHGLAAIFAGRLLIATGPRDKVEIGAYRLDGDRLTGHWVPPAASGADLAICGREESGRVDENVYEIRSAYAIDHQPYTGRLTISPMDASGVVRRVNLKWTLNDGEYASFGLLSGDILVSTFCFEADASHSIGLYHATAAGWQGGDIGSVSRQYGPLTLRRF